jgi:SAM-dependent MidA family methyltransferase
MPNPDLPPPNQAAERPKEYPIEDPPATPSLEGILREILARNGPIPFADYMATALYHPTLGYYAREPRQVGRSGDFFTSVSVGPMFGNLLARRFLKEWRQLGSPDRWRILECGAHDGTLAGDILDAIRQLEPEAFTGLEYAISEPLPLLRAAQHKALARFSANVAIASSLAEISSNPLPGVIFGNELLDALPFHVVEWRSGGWCEARVGSNPNGGFEWRISPLSDAELLAALAPLGSHFPEGYRTEIRTNLAEFLAPLLGCISSGLLVWPDYGFARPEFYHPERHRGTLRTFSKHQAAEDPFVAPGEIDITAHVDFTAVAETAISLGCKLAAFKNQGAWLTEVGREWLLSLEGQPPPQALRQFQTLTHPAHLGGSFHVLEVSWNQPGAKAAGESDFHRLALCACPGHESQ